MNKEDKLAAVEFAMSNMIQRGWFDICCVRASAKLLGVGIPSDCEQLFGTLHCTHFADMPERVKLALKHAVEETLGQKQFKIEIQKVYSVEAAPDSLKIAHFK